MTVFHELLSKPAVAQPILTIGSQLNHFFILAKLFIALLGTTTILIGAMFAIFRYFIFRVLRSQNITNINNIRLDLARTIILGLEFFIASDVIETTITPDFQSLGILCVLVIIRTILNYSLHKEVKELSHMSENK